MIKALFALLAIAFGVVYVTADTKRSYPEKAYTMEQIRQAEAEARKAEMRISEYFEYTEQLEADAISEALRQKMEELDHAASKQH